MEKLPTHEKRSSQKPNKKKPVKVVYISNPMKIKATPSEFRAVVQQLTGQYATSPPPEQLLTGRRSPIKEDQEKWQSKGTSMDAGFTTTGSDLSYDKFGCCSREEEEDGVIMDDDFITPQMLENFSPLLPSYFESSS